MAKTKKQNIDKEPLNGSELPTRLEKAISAVPLDDFILTISDTEDNVPVFDKLEDEASIDAAAVQPAQSPSLIAELVTKGKKRKHAAITKSTKTKLVGKEGVESEESEDIASDFEFQIGDGGVTLGEFDGWELDKAKGLDENKTAGDIDDIIRRRRHARGEKLEGSDDEQEEEKKEKKGNGKSKKANGKSKFNVGKDEDNEDDEGDLASSESEDAEDEEMSGIEIGSDDEDIAADGFGGAAGFDDEGVEGSNSEKGEDNSDEEAGSDSDSEVSAVPHPLDGASESEISTEDEAEEARQTDFFAPESETPYLHNAPKSGKTSQDTASNTSFQSMNLSRPILRGLASVGFTSPTLIQAKTIPFGLLGKDIVGGAVTGSGKTAAFVVPILERLLYRPKKVPTSRVLILCPTRELAMQCHAVAVKLAAFTDIKFALTVGGLNLKTQEAELRGRPDVIIATPGRFIDHMRNTAGVAVDSIEILVMDEADRMLEDGFADELNEIISHIPKSRQTMLFSATMTDSVDQLIRLSLNKPVRLMIDSKNSTVSTLVQEFVRIRPNREHMRLAMLVELCKNVYRQRCIIFFRSKQMAHRVRVLFGLLDLKAAELHGSLSQEKRVKSVELFRTSAVDFLLATDLASRGLDIKNVDVVLNYESPQSHEIYLHRVGRTARAGRSGRACTLAGESDRKIVKAAVKSAKEQGNSIAARVLVAENVEKWHKKIKSLEGEIEEILLEEKEEKALGGVEMQVKKGENLIKYSDEIKSRPQRSWFQSQADKQKAKEEMGRKLAARNPATDGIVEVAKKKEKLSGKKKRKLDGAKDREEGKVFKKNKAQRVEGQKRGSGVKTLMKKVKQKREKEGKAAKKNAVKLQRKKGKK